MNRACSTCPWRASNQGKPHPAGWYKMSNLRRLWRGLRTGAAPGMVCHSTDPKSGDYGSSKPPAPEAKPHECLGATILIAREFAILQATKDLKHYRALRPGGLTRRGFTVFAERAIFGGGVPTGENEPDIDLPWEISNGKK